MNPYVGGALIGAGANLVGNLLGKSSQDKANEFSAEQAQINREFQERMWNKQVEYNTEMWNKSNEYNSAKNQVARLREAGLNPALALGQVAAGSATSSPPQSVGLPSGAQSQANAYRYDFSGVANAAQMYFDNTMRSAKNAAEVDSLQLDNAYKRASFMVRLGLAKSEARKMFHDAAISQTDSQWRDSMHMSDFQLKWAQQQNQIAQGEKFMAETMILNKELEFLPQKLQLECANLSSQIALRAAQRNLTRQQLRTEVQNTFISHYKAKNDWFALNIIQNNLNHIQKIIENKVDTSNPYFQVFTGLLPKFSFSKNSSTSY